MHLLSSLPFIKYLISIYKVIAIFRFVKSSTFLFHVTLFENSFPLIQLQTSHFGIYWYIILRYKIVCIISYSTCTLILTYSTTILKRKLQFPKLYFIYFTHRVTLSLLQFQTNCIWLEFRAHEDKTWALYFKLYQYYVALFSCNTLSLIRSKLEQ